MTYHCAQLEEERPKHKERHRVGGLYNSQRTRERYHCNGWLNIYVTHGDNSRVRIRMTHDLIHPYPTALQTKSRKIPKEPPPNGHFQQGAHSMEDCTDEDSGSRVSAVGKSPAEDATPEWLPPVVASSCLPQSINKDRVSLYMFFIFHCAELLS